MFCHGEHGMTRICQLSFLFLIFCDPTRGITIISLKMMKGRMFVVRETIGSSGQMALHCNPMEKLWYLQNAIFS